MRSEQEDHTIRSIGVIYSHFARTACLPTLDGSIFGKGEEPMKPAAGDSSGDLEMIFSSAEEEQKPIIANIFGNDDSNEQDQLPEGSQQRRSTT